MFRMYAAFWDGKSSYFEDDNEELCMCRIAQAEDNHGKCKYYTSVTDGEHFINGEYYDYYDEENECYVVI